MISHHHNNKNDEPDTISCSIITVSDTRTKDTDESGKMIGAMLVRKAHHISDQMIVQDEPNDIEGAIHLVMEKRPDVIILNGGTGISKRDVTHEVVEKMFTKKIPGFGELFRLASLKEVGALAMLSSAMAGLVGQTVIFILPGSTQAVRLAMKQLILPELGHIVAQARTNYKLDD